LAVFVRSRLDHALLPAIAIQHRELALVPIFVVALFLMIARFSILVKGRLGFPKPTQNIVLGELSCCRFKNELISNMAVAVAPYRYDMARKGSVCRLA